MAERDATTEASVALVREAYRRWISSKGADAAGVIELIAEDVTWYVAGGGRPGLGGSRRITNRAEALNHLTSLMQEWEMRDFAAEEYAATGDRIVFHATLTFRHRRTGREVHLRKADLIRVRDGMIVEVAEFFDSAAVVECACD